MSFRARASILTGRVGRPGKRPVGAGAAAEAAETVG